MNQDTILSLVNRVVNNNDHAAFSRLVQIHQSMIRHFLRRLTAGNTCLAEDLSQEAFLLAFQKIHQFSSKGTFSAWLHTIAYRLFLKSINNIQTVDFDQDKHSQLIDLQSTSSTTDADIYAEQLMAILNYKERVVITLSCAAGMSHGEIENVTQLPLGSIKSLIQRAKQKIVKYAQQDLNPKQAQS
ncbi:MAG: RNA polymerase sigma factor [Marinicella sp.]